MEHTTDMRRGELDHLVEMLRTQHDVKYDVVVPSSELRALDGDLSIKNGAAEITDEGVTSAHARLTPTAGCDGQLAERLDIPVKYFRRMRDENVPLLDANINSWLNRDPARQFLVRGFRTDNPTDVGIARGVLSDRYRMVDHLDVLMAGLDGIAKSGVECRIDSCDLNDRRMRVRVSSPAVEVHAPRMLAGYRSPFQGSGHGGAPAANPEVVWGGFEITNSETGYGAMAITPRIRVLVCDNGMTITKDALRSIHVGTKLEAGPIRWSNETQQANLDLVAGQVKDAVATFLDVDYVSKVIRQIEAEGDVDIPMGSEAPVIERVCSALSYTEDEQASILSAFTRSGDTRAIGVMQAVTATAQGVDDADRAAELEASAIGVLAEVRREVAAVTG